MSINGLLTNTPILNALADSTKEIVTGGVAPQQVFGLGVGAVPVATTLTAAIGIANAVAVTDTITYTDVPIGTIIQVSYNDSFNVINAVATAAFYVYAFVQGTGAKPLSVPSFLTPVGASPVGEFYNPIALSLAGTINGTWLFEATASTVSFVSKMYIGSAPGGATAVVSVPNQIGMNAVASF